MDMKGGKQAALTRRQQEVGFPVGHQLEPSLDLAFVWELVLPCYAAGGRPSVDPVIFFRLRRSARSPAVSSYRGLFQRELDSVDDKVVRGLEASGAAGVRALVHVAAVGYLKRKSAVRGCASPISSCIVRHSPAQPLLVFQSY